MSALVVMSTVLERKEQAEDAALAGSAAPPTAGSAVVAGSRAAAEPVAAPRGPTGEQALAACANDCACREKVIAELLAKRALAAGLDALERGPEACRSREPWKVLRAEAAVRRADKDAAERARAVSLEFPNNPRAIANLARAALDKGDRDGARASARRALELGPDALAEIVLGRAALDEGAPKDALTHFANAARLDANEFDAVFFEGVAQRRLGKYHKAREALLAATRLNEADAEPRFELATMAREAGALDEARHHYRKAAALVSPDDARLNALATKLGDTQRNAPGGTYKVGSTGARE